MAPNFYEKLEPTELQIEEAENKKFAVLTIAGGLVLAAFTVLLFKWQDHVFTASVVSLKATVGLASNDELIELSSICRELQNADCVEKAHRQVASSSEAQIKDLEKYGHVLYLRGKSKEALAIYDEYFERGGDSFDAKFDYARLLSESHRNGEAKKYFLELINSKPNTLQHTVAAAYVDHLIKASDIKTAKRFITSWRAKGSNASGFLEPQWQKLKKLEDS